MQFGPLALRHVLTGHIRLWKLVQFSCWCVSGLSPQDVEFDRRSPQRAGSVPLPAKRLSVTV